MTNIEAAEPLIHDKSKEIFLNFPKNDHNQWTRKEKYVWFFTLLFGTTALYACRTTMPLVSPACAKSLNWSKTDVGTVLSSFFWGYTLTQIPGGYLSDRYGAERVLLLAGLIWGLLTFWFQKVVTWAGSNLRYVVLTRIMFGAAQGVHFPALASISSKNLNSKDRGFFFSATTAGGAIGTLVTGTIGSYMNETFGWSTVFYSIGFIALVWVAVLKYYAMNITSKKRTIVGMSSNGNLLSHNSSNMDQVPWLTYLKSPALWACIFCHFCQNNCFFILLSWLPTYFHDNFPEAKSGIFNVVPWILMVPGIGVAALITKKLSRNGHSVTSSRKIIESICLLTEAFCLVCIGLLGKYSFTLALFLMTICLFFAGFHNCSVLVNPQDLAPKHSGSILGIMNAAGAIPGFIGVYLVGYILEVTGSWSAVFNVTAVINLIGLSVFALFGSGTPIV